MSRLSHAGFFVSLALLMTVPGAARRITSRSQAGLSTSALETIMLLDASGQQGSMTVARQGEAKYSGRGVLLNFTTEDKHKEYVLAASGCEEPLFVKKGDGRMCSTGLFTTAKLTCAPLAAGTVETEVAKLAGLEAPSDRGVGLEFEFVGRELTPEKEEYVKEWMAEQGYSGWWAEFMLSGGQAQIAGLKKCFDESIAGWAAERREALSHWNWEEDGSVSALSPQEAASIGAGKSETKGVAFEVTSPGPPHVLAGKDGFRSAVEVIAGLKHFGIQAGPSQGMHVHVNVLNDEVPGTKLTHRQIAGVWAAYAKYQLIIDEMLSPGRPGNSYANRLFVSNCTAKSDRDSGKCGEDPCGCTRRFFNQMHSWLVSGQSGSDVDFCNAVLTTKGSTTPCTSKYPHQRYFQVNLVPLKKFGTMEFRAYSATYDPERIMRWVQFLVAFVEYFGNGPGIAEVSGFFESSSSDEGWYELARAQRDATAADLFAKLSGKIDEGSEQHFTTRAWEEGDATCSPAGPPTTLFSECAESGFHHDDETPGTGLDENDFGDIWGDLFGGGGLFGGRSGGGLFGGRSGGRRGGGGRNGGGRGGRGFWHPFSLVSEKQDVQILRVQVPEDAKPGSYLEVLMPEGNVRAIQVNQTSVDTGFHEFVHVPAASAQLRTSLRPL